ncbi:MAG TPA: MBL fold metallo-hydrolase [Phenylobacterium sp.]
MTRNEAWHAARKLVREFAGAPESRKHAQRICSELVHASEWSQEAEIQVFSLWLQSHPPLDDLRARCTASLAKIRRGCWGGESQTLLALPQPQADPVQSFAVSNTHSLSRPSRRAFGAGAIMSVLGRSARASALRETRVVLLGTKGGPTPSKFRAPASVAILVDRSLYLIDCPNGVAGQLAKGGIGLDQLSQVFITHDHSDHVLDAGSLLVLAWASGLTSPVTLHGPPPLKSIVDHSIAASSYDIAARIREEGRPPLRPLVQVREHANGGLIYRDAHVTVTSTTVDHYTVKPAFAYRFDTPTRSIVVSGDTTYSEHLARLADGADLLIHEAMYPPALDQLAGDNRSLKDHLVRSHSTTEQVGLLAARAGVKKLVLSHLVPAFPSITDEMWLEGVRKNFKGEAVVGRDLQDV